MVWFHLMHVRPIKARGNLTRGGARRSSRTFILLMVALIFLSNFVHQFAPLGFFVDTGSFYI
jgi:hypothetical protein